MNMIHVPLDAIRSLPQADRVILRGYVRGGNIRYGYYLEDEPVIDILARNHVPVQVADHKAWNNCRLCNPARVTL